MKNEEEYLGNVCANCFRKAPDDARRCTKCNHVHCENCFAHGSAICFRCDGSVGGAIFQRNLALKEMGNEML